jgi:alkylation response protein AidB-like acyl-CoA dehydrogenase
MDFSRSPEQDAFVARVQQFAREVVEPRAASIDETARFPRDLLTAAAQLGLTGVTLDPRWGGGGRDYLSYALAIEAVAVHSATLAVILAVTHSLVAEPIAAFGSAAARDRWLGPLVSGTAIGAFALSEAQAGSDAANQQTTAKPDGNGYRITGEKVWVANGEVADVALVFAAARPEAVDRGITAFLVALDQAGVSRRVCDSLGVRGLGCVDLTFEDVHVPAEARLGEMG